MRKFALLPLIFGLAGVGSAEAQVRDLFAEFEEEAQAKEAPVSSVAEVPASSAAVQTSSAATPASSESTVPASSAAVPASSAVVVSSSSAVVSSSSEVLSSSSVAESSSSEESSSSFVAPTDRGPVSADTLAHPPVDSAQVQDSAAVTDSSSVPHDSATIAADSSVKDSVNPGDAYMKTMNAAVDSARTRDSLAALSSSSSSETAVNISSSSMSRRDLLGPVKVSKVYGIDEMKGRYKSPRKAMFMSLVVPGSGQLYIGGSTFTNVRGGVYLALEAALWGSWYYFSVHKYDEQVDKYKKFAKKHYSIGRYEAGMRELFLQLSDETEETRFESRYMNSREDFCKAIYGTATASGCYTKGKLFTNDRAHTDRFSIKNPSSLDKEIEKQKNFYDMSVVYQHLGDKSYVLGWDDVDNREVVVNLGLEDGESETVPLASSDNMDEYRSMRNKANDYADMQAWFFGGIILNHLVSAIDAAFTAYSHNKALYSEDLSWYNHLHFDSYFSFLDGYDVGVQASWGF